MSGTLPNAGPLSHRNWRAALEGRVPSDRHEIPLYSDFECSLPQLAGLGPHELQHAFPVDFRDPAMLLHVSIHLAHGDIVPPMTRSETRSFTGASLGDEFAALLSLVNARRVAAGGVTRFSSMQGGQIVVGDRDRPTFLFASADRIRGHALRLPRQGERIAITAGALPSYPRLSPNAATAVVRAARAYRDAIWLAEKEPELSWLLLVTAIEIAATHEQMSALPLDILKAAKPDLVEDLERISPPLAAVVADALARELRATARFREFMRRFMPAPPAARPEVGKVDWSTDALMKAMVKIYALRSKSLHDGIPFPPPICDIPMRDSVGIAAERPFGLASSTLGGVWMAEDLPMHLHVFEYIAQGALTQWWEDLAQRSSASGFDAPAV